MDSSSIRVRKLTLSRPVGELLPEFFKMEERTVAFKVAAVSSSTNSFGLRGMILISRNGQAWSVAANQLHVRQRGAVLHVPLENTGPSKSPQLNWSRMGYELPQLLKKAPPAVVAEAWALPEPASSPG